MLLNYNATFLVIFQHCDARWGPRGQCQKKIDSDTLTVLKLDSQR